MRKSPIAFLLATAIVAVACHRKPSYTEGQKISDSHILMQLMPDPPAAYRPIPLWDWNDVITKEEIAFQMKKFKEGGLGGVFVHPRPGLVTEYLSKDWNEMFHYAVETAKKLGMQVWIYDENSYPSGFAGGHVQARYPDSYTHGTGLGMKLTSDLKGIDTLKVEVLLKKTVEKGHETDPPLYYVFYRTYAQPSYWYGGFPYVDLLYPGVTDTFMKVTMEGYEKYDRDEFGKTLPGIFTDEPNLEAAKGPGTVLRWTPDLFDEFEARWGYRLEPELVSLVEETDDYTRIRHDYYTLLLEMFLDRWAVPWSKYCESNNLKWTGHYWEHGWPYPGEGFDESSFYQYHQMPGVDMLGRSYDSTGMAGQFGNTRAIRELGSAANQAGRIRRLSETWGGAGWQISFAELKRLVDWEVALGVNFVNPHLSFYSLQGVRKFDYPASFSYQEPWWSDFSILGDYIGRISLAMSSGEQLNHILIIQPNTTAWMYHSSVKNDPRIYNLSVTFKKFIQQLESEQVEYDLGSEQVIRRFGHSGRGGLTIRNRTYNHIILPPGIRNIDTSTLQALEDYISSGNSVLCFSDSIDFIDGRKDSAIHRLAEKYPVNWIRENDPASDHIRPFMTNPDISVRQTDPAHGQLFHQRRILDDGQLLFLVNSDLSSPAEADISIRGGHLAGIDLLTGHATKMKARRLKGILSFSCSVPPGGSRLFLVTRRALKVESRESGTMDETEIKPADEIVSNRLSPNVLTIDYLDLTTKSFSKNDMYFMKAMYKLFDISGLKTGNPWQHKIQYRQQYLDMDHFGPDSWFMASYHFEVDQSLTDEAIGSLRAVVERPDQWEVRLNGTLLAPDTDRWWLDNHFPVYDIEKSVRRGENILELSAPKMTVFSELMPVYILGDFSLEPVGRGFLIKPAQNPGLASWKDAGMPFYSNQVSYAETYTVDQPKGKYRIELSAWKGPVAEVWVNGSMAGRIAWKPWTLDVTPYIREGSNQVEVRVTGTLKNTLGYHHVVQSGWIDSPFSWNSGPETQPPGSEYQFMDYGLFQPFRLVNTMEN